MKEKLAKYNFDECCMFFPPVLADSVPNHSEAGDSGLSWWPNNLVTQLYVFETWDIMQMSCELLFHDDCLIPCSYHH